MGVLDLDLFSWCSQNWQSRCRGRGAGGGRVIGCWVVAVGRWSGRWSVLVSWLMGCWVLDGGWWCGGWGLVVWWLVVDGVVVGGWLASRAESGGWGWPEKIGVVLVGMVCLW